jgi:Na+/H+ antiporter NhaB
MSMQARLMLFVLSALALVICPAVMVSLYHTITATLPNAGWIVAAIGVVPVGIVMVICFIGLFFAIFRSRAFSQSQ